ncbi:MAG: hypothetical protein FJ265_23150 [Planctomycetes bacterium]|nr:hypothetical protein [Planctomycetota bacterium]
MPAVPVRVKHVLTPRWMAIKAAQFLMVAGLAAFVVLWRDPSWTVGACLVLLGWSCSRAYYFVFYVVERYVDPSYRFAGLLDFARWLARNRRA